ncbi:MAG: SPOR domain-containing protein [Pseudomonadota bacterium]
MSIEFSLDGKRTVFAVIAGTVLIILIFLAGLVSGIMIIPGKGLHRESVTAPRATTPPQPRIGSPTSPQVTQLPTKPTVIVPQPAQGPRAAISQLEGEKRAKEQEIKSVIRRPIVAESPPPKQEPVVEKPQEPKEIEPKGKMVYSVQAGAFLNKKNAEEFVTYLSGKGYNPYMRQLLDTKKRTWYSVRIADCEAREEANRIASEFKSKEKMPAIVTYIDSLTGVKPASSPSSDALKKSEGAPTPEKGPSDKQKEGGAKSSEGAPSQKMVFLIRVASFRVENNALRMADSLKEKGYDASTQKSWDNRGKPWYMVLIGEYEEKEKAHQTASEFTKKEKIVANVEPMRLFQLEKMKKTAQAMAKTEAVEPAETPEKREPVKTSQQKPPEVKTQ